MREVADAHGITMADLKGPRRLRSVAWPRQEAYLRLREETGKSLPEIAALFGGRDHTTVLYGIRKAAARRAGA